MISNYPNSLLTLLNEEQKKSFVILLNKKNLVGLDLVKELNEDKLPAYNKVLPKAGLNGFDWTFVQGSTFVLRLNFSAKNPRLRQYPKR